MLSILFLLLFGITLIVLVIIYSKYKEIQKKYELLRDNKFDGDALYFKSRYASMGETVGNIAHQWKQPLNAIGSIQNSIKAALIFQGEISKEKLLSSVETSFKLIQHLAETIDTFYSFLSQQNNKKMNFVVADELEKVRKITEYSFQNSNIDLQFKLEVNPTIAGNANEFTHAMLNIILNAKDAFDGGSVSSPKITVHVSESEERCVISICDNAGGIRLDPIDMVFDLHISTKEAGSGLGLFMTKNIVENRFGGKISVANINHGACFTIELPYAEYGERFHDIATLDEKTTLERINKLSHKVIELEEVEKALKMWADIFKHAHWGIAIYVEASQSFEMTNSAFNSLYGYTSKEIQKLTLADFFTPQTLPFFLVVQKEAIKQGYAVLEAVHKRKDGVTFPVSIELIVVKDDKDKILYQITNVWDLTEKKMAEQRLLLKKFALNNINDAVFLIDKNSNFHYINESASATLGYTNEELLNMGVIDIEPHISIQIWNEHWLNIKNYKTTLAISEYRKKDGTTFPVEVSSNYFEYEGIGYSLAISRDISERLEVQKRKDDEKMCLFFERQLVGMAITSPTKGWLHVNDKLCEILGYSLGELQNMTLEELTHPDDLAGDIRVLNRLLSGEIEHDFYDKRFIKKDGSIIFANLSIGCIRKEDGSVDYLMVLIKDITQQKKAYEALANKERELRSLTENIPDNVARWDTQGRYLYINPTQESLLGVTLADVVSKSFIEVFPHIDFSILENAIFKTVASKEKVVVHQQVPGDNGKILVHDINLVPEFDVNGEVVSVLGIGRDMTEIYALQKELISKEQELRALAESSPGMVGSFLMRKDGSVCMPYVSTNIVELFGLESNDVMKDATILLSLTHPDDIKRVKDSIEQSAKTMKIWHEEYRIIHPSKGERWMESNTMPQVYPEGGIVWYGYVHDVTERKKAQKEIKAANATLEERVFERTAELTKKEMEFRTLAENMPDFLVRYDKAKRRRYVNPAFCNYVGISSKKLLGTTPQENPTLGISLQVEQNVDYILQTAQKMQMEIEGEQNGKKIYWNLIFAPEFDEDGNVESVILIGHDISGIKEAQIKIIEESQKFSKLFMLSPVAVSVISLERNIYLEVNESFLHFTKYSREEVIGKSSACLQFFANINEKTEFYRRVLEEGVVRDFEFQYLAKDGTMGYSLAFATLVYIKGEKCVLSQSYNINGKKQIELVNTA